MKDEEGFVYVLHFDPPYKHARHYTGWTKNFRSRLRHHLAGRGGNLVKVAVASGSKVIVGQIWFYATRSFERKIKNRGGGKNGARHYCLVCRGTHPCGL